MSNKKLNIYTLGLCGFPHGTAAVQKLLLMARALVSESVSFTVISHTFLKKNDLNKALEKKGSVYGIDYYTTSPYVFSPKGKVIKIYAKTVGILKEVLGILFNYKKVDVIILYSYKYFYVLFWSILSKVLNIPVYLIYFELRSSFTIKKSYWDKVNDELHDKNSFKWVNGIITISKELIKQIRKNSPDKPCFIVPPIVDYTAYDDVAIKQDEFKTFLFCGAVSYTEIIDFIITSFRQMLHEAPNARLMLIINGEGKDIDAYGKLIEEQQLENRIVIQSGLTNKELIQAYKSAYALLIPLRNTLQDTARFPQKVAEYCASQRPIITTPYGDIVDYLNDESAFYCPDYSTTSFSQMMLHVYKNEGLANQVGGNSYRSGKKHFDYKSYSISLLNFIEKNKG